MLRLDRRYDMINSDIWIFKQEACGLDSTSNENHTNFKTFYNEMICLYLPFCQLVQLAILSG